jgi:hypothetical protein
MSLSRHTAQAHHLKEMISPVKSSPIGLPLGSVCKEILAPNFSLDKYPSHRSLGNVPGSRQPPLSVGIALVSPVMYFCSLSVDSVRFLIPPTPTEALCLPCGQLTQRVSGSDGIGNLWARGGRIQREYGSVPGTMQRMSSLMHLFHRFSCQLLFPYHGIFHAMLLKTLML